MSAPTDPRYKPLTAWNYFWLQILFSIPVIGFIFLIVFSFSTANYNRRSFARSYFCIFIVYIIAFIILVATGGAAALIQSLT